MCLDSMNGMIFCFVVLGLIAYFKKYWENEFASTLESTKKLTIKMNVESKFREIAKWLYKKLIIHIISNFFKYFVLGLNISIHASLSNCVSKYNSMEVNAF
jgi:hypothetical protein